MSELMYNQNMTQNQLYRIYRDKIRKNNIMASTFSFQSYIQFPYYFQSLQRIQLIRKKQRQLLLIYRDRVLSEVKRKFILIKKVIDFDIQDQAKVKETCIIDRKSLQIISKTEASLSTQFYSKLLKSHEQKQKNNIKSQKNCQKHFFFGRSFNMINSMTFDNPSVSKKHLIIQKLKRQSKNNDKKLLNFLFCLKKSRQKRNTSKMMKLWSSLSRQIIEIIISYTESKNQKNNEFMMFDFASKNGTKLFHKNKNEILLSETQKLIVEQCKETSINMQRVIKCKENQNLTEQINKKIRDLQLKNYVQLYNRNMELQKQIQLEKKQISVMMLAIQTPKLKKLYILYQNNSTGYMLIKQQNNLALIENEKENPEQVLAEIEFSESSGSWRMKNFHNISVFEFMKSKKYYQMQSQNYFCLGSDQKIIIYLH